MNIIFRSSTRSDLKWFRKYYTYVFPEGERRAKNHYLQTYKTLLDYPQVGSFVSNCEPVRELSIPRTPFSFVYYITEKEIVIIRVLDSRSNRPENFAI
jgi:plasmid stabilization system protein ParE